MTRRSVALPFAALTSLAILVAACGGGSATTAPGATQGAATQVPAATAGGTALAIPTFHSDQNLESLFPDTLGGETVSVQSVSGTEFMGLGGATELQAVLTALGKTPADMSVAIGGAGGVLISAVKINGANGPAIMNALFAAYQAETATVTDVTFGGKAVKKITQSDSPDDITYIYTAQDVVFAVGSSGGDLTDAQLTEAFSKLP